MFYFLMLMEKYRNGDRGSENLGIPPRIRGNFLPQSFSPSFSSLFIIFFLGEELSPAASLMAAERQRPRPREIPSRLFDDPPD